MRAHHLLLIGVALAASACQSRTGRDARSARTEFSGRSALDAAIRAKADIVLAADTTVVSAKVAGGATLDSILRAQHIVATDITELILHASRVFDLRKVRRDQPYRLEVTPQNT